MFAAVGHHVVALHRAALGALTLGGLAAGAWRVLEPAEVETLRASAVKGREA
jgi:16S rRNA U516 pseudouridylate synthase RsuA-like enzyme